ncbi:hypothetical protein MTO96_023061 [Rhipicephalus appendiculatus]
MKTVVLLALCGAALATLNVNAERKLMEERVEEYAMASQLTDVVKNARINLGITNFESEPDVSLTEELIRSKLITRPETLEPILTLDPACKVPPMSGPCLDDIPPLLLQADD